MSLSQWKEFWQVGRTGFHQSEVHAELIAHSHWLLQDEASVLVPLCGKTRDLMWLAERSDVMGVEMVSQAIEEWGEANGLSLTSESCGEFVRWTSMGPPILQGNFFDVSRTHVGARQAVWDRAALVAIRPENRPQYVSKLVELLGPGGRVLLVTWDAARPADVGPPYRLPAEQVQALFTPYAQVERTRSVVQTAEEDERVAAKGLDWVRLETYQITLK